MQISLPTLSAFAVVFSAIVAGFFLILRGHLDRKSSKLQAKISQDNALLQARLTAGVKLAEFRQDWINQLRHDMASYQALGLKMHHDKTHIFEFLEMEHRIRLRMNPNDERYKALMASMEGVRSSKKAEDAFDAMNAFIKVCQNILKSEWNKLRDELQTLSPTAHPDLPQKTGL